MHSAQSLPPFSAESRGSLIEYEALDHGRLAGERNLPDMTMIGAAASAKHSGVGQQATKLGVFAAKLHGVAVIEIGGLVELGMAAPRGVGADPADALDPALSGGDGAGK
jgi:hypothetical protein